jgi:hypothetical protein
LGCGISPGRRFDASLVTNFVDVLSEAAGQPLACARPSATTELATKGEKAGSSLTLLPPGRILRQHDRHDVVCWSVMTLRKKILVGIGSLVILAPPLLYWLMPFLQTAPIPVPASAHWVRYKAACIPGPGFEEWTSFTVPKEECLPAAEAILKKELQALHTTNEVVIKHRAIGEGSPVEKITGPWWFKPSHIQNGTVLFLHGAQAPFLSTIWIDNDTGTVYQHMSD